MLNKRYVILLTVLGCAAVLSMFFDKSRVAVPENKDIADFPNVIFGYSGTDIPLGSDIYDMLETKNIIMRTYSKEGKPSVLFYLIFSPATHKGSDPPENCLIGDGMTITEKSVDVMTLSGPVMRDLKVNKLTVEKEGIKQMYLYWFLAGNRFTESYFHQRASLLKAYLSGRPLSGGQVRISTEIIDNNEEEAFSRLQEFVSESMPFILEFLS